MINEFEKDIRQKEVEKAIAYNSVDGIPPSYVLNELFNRYIDSCEIKTKVIHKQK